MVLGYEDAYGDEHVRKVIGNVKALTRAEINGHKHIARGEFGIFIHPTPVGAADTWRLPKPLSAAVSAWR